MNKSNFLLPLPLWERSAPKVTGEGCFLLEIYLNFSQKHPSSGLRPPSPTRGEGSFMLVKVKTFTKAFTSPLVGEVGAEGDG